MTKTLAKGALMTGALLAALVAGGAMAADLKAPAPMLMKAPPPPAFSWTGCYVGGGGGYAVWNQEDSLQTDPGHVVFSQTETGGGRGWFGTATFGCDYQVSSSFVIGAFGDWDFGDIKGQIPTSGLMQTGTESEKSAWAAGARIGYLVTPTILTYFAGGYTQAHFDPVSLSFVFPPFTSSGLNIASHNYHGYFLGSGFEYAISMLPSGFFLRSEYRYSTYQADDISILLPTGGLFGDALHTQKWVQSVRSELIYRISWH